jgi:DnaK suppressor protein
MGRRWGVGRTASARSSRGGLRGVKGQAPAAPKNPPMNSTDTAFPELRQRLQQRAAQLRDEIELAQQRPADGDDATHEVLDRKDQAGLRALDGVAAAEVERDRTELAAVEAALERLVDGRYGRCADCGEPIGTQRLQAQPAALRCLDCQAAAERA